MFTLFFCFMDINYFGSGISKTSQTTKELVTDGNVLNTIMRENAKITS